jgi:peptidoglycan/LPS O-acetylase OafA/YrhL
MATAEPVTSSAASRSRRARSQLPSLPYQPALDGLRGVAVIAVLLYHGGVTWMRGGFLGVDLFFVLSGYLITTLLFVEWGKRRRIDVVAFWIRRARRLLPALGLLIFGVMAYTVFVADPSQAGQIRGDAIASMFYVANWRFVISGQSYFAGFAAPSPLRHMWSLAIEEQFYLVWPFIVVALLKWRPRLRLLAWIFAGGAIASTLLMAALYDAGGDPSRVYYGTDTRAQALFVGGALAAVLARAAMRRGRPARSAPWARGGLVGAAVVGTMLVATPDTASWMYRGGYLLVAVAGAAVIAAVVQPRRNVVRAALSPMPLRAVGKISYGLYLWHWPVFLTMTEARTGQSGTPLLLARLAVTTGLALVSYFLVEMPVRRGAWPRRNRRTLVTLPTIAGALAVVIILVTVVRAGSEEGVSVAVVPPTTAATGTGTTLVPPASVLVVGDSVAKTLGDGFDRESHAAGLRLYNRAQLACGLAQKARIEHGGIWAATESNCDDWPDKWQGWINELHPAVSVVVFDVFVVQDLEVDGTTLTFGTPESDKYLLTQLDEGIDRLRAGGGTVALLTSPYNQRTEVAGQPVRWNEDDPSRIDHWNALLRKYAKKRADPSVVVIDLNRHLSPKGKFTNTLDGVELRYDGVHFNPSAGQLVFRWLLSQLPRAA